jgi:hypothetical protein
MRQVRTMDLVKALPGGPDVCARGAFGCMGPLPQVRPHRRRTWLGEVLVLQLAKLTALPLFGSPWIGQPIARAAPAASFTPLLLAPRCARRNHRRPLATENMQVLEVSFEALSGMISEPS